MKKAGFTFVELLAVVAVMAVIMALAVPAFHTVGRSTNLTTGANMVIDQLNLARQTALSQDRIVQVRFYFLPGPTDGSTATAYRAMRLFIYDSGGITPTAVSGVRYLPTGTIMISDATGTFSTLMPIPNAKVTTSLAPITGTESVPGFNNAAYVAFQFRPSGGTNLDPNGPNGTDKWFLTLKLQNDPAPAGGTRPAANFVTVLVDPVSGRTRVFRP